MLRKMDTLQWQSFLKSCLDILRNGDSKYDGLKAIGEFISLITIKLVENRIVDENIIITRSKTDMIKIGEDCKFTNLYNNYCVYENKDDMIRKARDLYDLLYNIERIWDIDNQYDDVIDEYVGQTKKRNTNKECIIVRFNRYAENISKATKHLDNFRIITSFTRDHFLDVQKLIIKIQETFNDIDIELFDYDAFGNAYEKMLADELGNGSKRNGQYFTKRDLIKLIVDELDIKETDKCYDPSCGTGGFLLGFLNKHKKNQEFIKNNVYGQEYLPDVYKTLSFNLIANNFDGVLGNITQGDSMNKNYHKKIIGKFDVVGGNPPFGLSIDNPPEEYKIKVKDSVCLFLQHIYYSLKDGGRAGIVIDRGILNNGADKKNSWEGKLRKFLLENTNIYKIINLPTGIFKHTNFATSVIFFIKGEVTEQIEYIEGYFTDKDKGRSEKEMFLGESKMVSIDEIKSKNYSLKLDDFKERDVSKDDNDIWIKLGDIVNILQKSKHKASDVNEKGQYNFYTSSNIIKKSNYNEYQEKLIILGSGGNGSLFIDSNFSCSADNFLMNIKNTNFIMKYVYYYLKINFGELYKLYSGQALKHISKVNLLKYKIPNIPLEHQNEIVEFLDKVFENESIDEFNKHLKDFPIFNLLLSKNYNDFNEMLHYKNRLIFVKDEIKNIERCRNNSIRGVLHSMTFSQCEEVKLGDVCKTNGGVKFKLDIQPSEQKSDYIYLRGQNLDDYKLRNGNFVYFNKYTKKFDNYKLNIGDLYYVLVGNVGICGLSNINAIISGNLCSIHSFNKNIDKKYIMYYLINNKPIANKNAQPNISRKTLLDIKIPIPSLEKQQEIINKIENIQSTTSHYTKYAEMMNNELNNIIETINGLTLFDFKLNDNNTDYNEEEYNEVDDEEQDDESDKQEDDEEEIFEIIIKKVKHYLIGENVYTIKDEEKDKLIGYYRNEKFIKL